MEDDVMGKANNNGTIILNKDLDPSDCASNRSRNGAYRPNETW